MFKQESKFNKSEARIDGRLSLVRSATIAQPNFGLAKVKNSHSFKK